MALGTSAKELLGTWHYGSGPFSYLISESGGGCLDFHQKLNDGRMAQGRLQLDGNMWQSYLVDLDGAHVGAIRLHRATDARSLVSNFRFAGSSVWGGDTVAHQGGESLAKHDAMADRAVLHVMDDDDAGSTQRNTLRPQARTEPDGAQIDPPSVCSGDEDDLARALSQIMDMDDEDLPEHRGSHPADLDDMVAIPWAGGKINASSGWDCLWAQLKRRGWRVELGPKGEDKQIYYMPPNVQRRAPSKCRVDYFDSKKLVLRNLLGSRKLLIDVSGEGSSTREAQRPTASMAEHGIKRAVGEDGGERNCKRAAMKEQRVVPTPTGGRCSIAEATCLRSINLDRALSQIMDLETQ